MISKPTKEQKNLATNELLWGYFLLKKVIETELTVSEKEYQ